MDISKAPGTKGKGCTYEGTAGNVPFIVGGRGPASLHHIIADKPGLKERLYLLRYKRGNVAIEVGPEGASLPEYLEAGRTDRAVAAVRVSGFRVRVVEEVLDGRRAPARRA